MTATVFGWQKSVRNLSRLLFGSGLLLAGLMGSAQFALGQSTNCNSPTPINGVGHWGFYPTCCGSNWGVLGCGLMDDQAVFWEWTASADGDYKVYTSGVGESSLAISSSTDCLIAYQHLLGCSFDSDLPILILGATAGDIFLIEVSTYTPSPQRLLNIERMSCGVSDYVEDGLEENDTLASAVALSEGVYPNLAVRFDDPDFYRIMIPAGEELRVKAGDSDSDVQVTLYDDQGQVVASTNSGDVATYAPGVSVPRRASIGIEIPIEAGVENCSDYVLHLTTHPIVQSLETFCDPAIPNSTGSQTVLYVQDDYQGAHTEASLFAYAKFGPPGEFGYLVSGNQVQQLGSPMGTQPICIGGNIGRYNEGGTPLNSIGVFDAGGTWSSFSSAVHVSTWHGYLLVYPIPDQLPNGMGTLMVGQSWGFQLWHRESGGNSATSNGVLVNW